MRGAEGAFDQLVNILVPDGGALVALGEVYVDESGSHAGSDILAVAGYVFLKSRSRAFCRAWADELRAQQVPHFHMTDCANGRGIYKNWSLSKRVAHETRLIELTTKYSSFGFSTCVNETDYYDVIGEDWIESGGTAYSFLLRGVLYAVARWAEQTGYKGKFAYFFEAGHRDAAQASALILNAMSHSHIREELRYFSHTFIDKNNALPIHAADLLAWLARNTYTRVRLRNGPPRKDMIALLRKQDAMRYFDRNYLKAIRLQLDGDLKASALQVSLAHTLAEI